MGATAAGGSGSGRGDDQARRELADDLHATLGARRDLGADYDRVLADSFVERVDDLVARRVADELAARQRYPQGQPWPGQQWLGPGQVPYQFPSAYASPPPVKPEGYPTRLALLSIVIGWLASASVQGDGGVDSVLAIAMIWLGITAVNGTVAIGVRRRRPPERPPG